MEKDSNVGVILEQPDQHWTCHQLDLVLHSQAGHPVQDLGRVLQIPFVNVGHLVLKKDQRWQRMESIFMCFLRIVNLDQLDFGMVMDIVI